MAEQAPQDERVGQAMPPPPAQVISIPMWREQIASLNKLNIKEKMRIAEVLSGWEMNNKYDVFDENMQNIMHIEQSATCFQRQCCNPICRASGADASQVVGGVKGSPFMHLDKPFTCTICCLNRPEIEVTDVQNTNTRLGVLKVPFRCCDCKMSAKSASDEHLFDVKLKGGCCQAGVLCPCPCGPCATVKFTVQNPEGKEIGTLTKKVPGFLKFLISDADNYVVDFGDLKTPEEKALLLSTAIAIDLTFFNKNEG